MGREARRYRLLETIRQYTREKLADADEGCPCAIDTWLSSSAWLSWPCQEGDHARMVELNQQARALDPGNLLWNTPVF